MWTACQVCCWTLPAGRLLFVARSEGKEKHGPGREGMVNGFCQSSSASESEGEDEEMSLDSSLKMSVTVVFNVGFVRRDGARGNGKGRRGAYDARCPRRSPWRCVGRRRMRKRRRRDGICGRQQYRLVVGSEHGQSVWFG
ncbi:hypothetical protein OF83DRAFT_1135039 [Amylostereum chailletii]|nr:hypothetical protein OF83DRAFT_1135039 [Amylostereum chailletii]